MSSNRPLHDCFLQAGRQFTDHEELAIGLLAEELCSTFEVERGKLMPLNDFDTLLVSDLNRPNRISGQEFLFTVSKRMNDEGKPPEYHLSFSNDEFYIRTISFKSLIKGLSGHIKEVNALAVQEKMKADMPAPSNVIPLRLVQ